MLNSYNLVLVVSIAFLVLTLVAENEVSAAAVPEPCGMEFFDMWEKLAKVKKPEEPKEKEKDPKDSEKETKEKKKGKLMEKLFKDMFDVPWSQTEPPAVTQKPQAKKVVDGLTASYADLIKFLLWW